MDGEEGGFVRAWDVVESGSGDDKDGGVDEEGEAEEGYGELGNGEVEAELDGGERGLVEGFARRLSRTDGDVVVLEVVVEETRLDDARSEVEGVRHNCGA